MSRRRLALLVPLVLLVPQAPLVAQDLGGKETSGDRLVVYLVTFGPGPALWERFGHNLIWIRDPVTGTGPAYDFGRFDFQDSGFFLRFARGRMSYWEGREEGSEVLARYARAGRSVWLQELNLPPQARVRLRDSLEASYGRDHGRYRYDYYLDNCSTRLREALDLAAGGAIRRRLDTAGTGTSYRDHTRRSVENNPLVYALLDAALGPVVDRPISRWAETFLPERLRVRLREVVILDGEGRPTPLVKAEWALSDRELYPVPAVPGTRLQVALPALGVLLGGALVGLAWLGRRGVRAMRRAFLMLAGAWEATAALAGGLLVWFWAFSDHVVAYANAQMLQFNLLAAVLLLLLPGAVRGRPGPVRTARVVAGLLTAASALGLLLLGVLTQQGGEIAAFALPAHLAVQVGLLLLRPTTPLPSAAPPAPR